MEGNELIELVDKYGTWGGVGMALLTLIYSFIKSEKMGELLKGIAGWFRKSFSGKGDDVTISDIVNHDIFTQMDYWTYSKVPTYDFGTDYRNVVFRKYLAIYLRVYKKNLKAFVQSGDFKKMDRAELWTTWLSTFNKIVYEYELECKSAGIPDVVINKMKERNNDSLQLMMELSHSIIVSNFYADEDNLLRVYSIMNIILSVSESTIIGAEKVCSTINGELRGQTMDGFTEL
jgi:hypothetical protein